MDRANPQRFERARAAKPLLGLICLLLVLLHAFAVQTHMHPKASALGWSHHASRDVAYEAWSGAAPAETACVFCQVLAAGGGLLPAEGPAATPSAVGEMLVPPLRAQAAAATSSHHWRSRAPPSEV